MKEFSRFVAPAPRRGLVRGLVLVPLLMFPLVFLASPVETTVYINRFFEVRDHDQPVKYVYNNDTRVARVTGSLSANNRIQRLRLFPGWNLLSLAVTAGGALRQMTNGQSTVLSPQAIFQWSQPTLTWLPVAPDDTLPAGTVLWVHAATNTTLALYGPYAEPAARTVPAGPSFQPGAGLEALPLPVSGIAYSLWHHDAAGQLWDFQAPSFPGGDPGFPDFIGPGDAVFIQAGASAQWEVPDPAPGMRYYHGDHLGSATVTTDARGALVEETAFYPFGTPRSQYQPGQIAEDYTFTQKERDRESHLYYYGRRYYHPALGRWLSTDPEEEKGGGLNLYAYAQENPLKYVDPDGGEVKVTPTFSGTGKHAKIVHYQIHVTAVLINLSPKLKAAGYDRAAVEAFAKTLQSTIEHSYSGKEGGVTWSTKVDIRVIDKVDEIRQGEHVFRLVDQTYDHGRGLSARGGYWMEIAAETFTAARPAKQGSVKDYLSPESTGAHELGHTEGLDHWTKDSPNLMQEGSKREFDNQTINLKQIESIYQEYSAGHLNRGPSNIGSWEYNHTPAEKRVP